MIYNLIIFIGVYLLIGCAFDGLYLVGQKKFESLEDFVWWSEKYVYHRGFFDNVDLEKAVDRSEMFALFGWPIVLIGIIFVIVKKLNKR